MDEPSKQNIGCSQSSNSLISTLIDLMSSMDEINSSKHTEIPAYQQYNEMQHQPQLYCKSKEHTANIPFLPEILDSHCRKSSCGTLKRRSDSSEQSVLAENDEVPKRRRKSKYSDIVGDLSHLSREPRRKHRNRSDDIAMERTSKQSHYQCSNNGVTENPICGYSASSTTLKQPHLNISSIDHQPFNDPIEQAAMELQRTGTNPRFPLLPQESSDSSLSTHYGSCHREPRNILENNSVGLPRSFQQLGAEGSQRQKDTNNQVILARKLIEILMCPKSKAHQNCVLAILREDKDIKDLFIQEKAKLGIQVIPVFRTT